MTAGRGAKRRDLRRPNRPAQTLEARQIVVAFACLRAIDDVSITWRRRGLRLIGPNGAGKTTLVNV